MTPKLRAYLIVITTLLVTLGPMLYGNLIAKKGGLMDDILLNRQDPHYLHDQRVKAYKSEGLKTGDPVAFVIPLPNGPTADSFGFVKKFTDDLKVKFPEFGILSLSIAARYHDTGTELLHEPYVSSASLEALRYDPVNETARWKAAVRGNTETRDCQRLRQADHALY